jgi:FkbM family methyltransferase
MREILYSGKYELAERRIVAKCLESSDTVLEIGTGLGLLAVLCAKRVGSERVVTVEANPALIPVIRETFELNGVRPELKNCVLGKGHGELVFYVMKDFWSSSTVKRSDSATPVMVAQQDFADLLATVRPTFLIIDIEGGEYDLLKDMELPFVRKIAIELHERVIGRDKTTSVLESLARQGFLAVDHLCFGREQLYLERTTDAKTTA